MILIDGIELDYEYIPRRYCICVKFVNLKSLTDKIVFTFSPIFLSSLICTYLTKFSIKVIKHYNSFQLLFMAIAILLYSTFLIITLTFALEK